MNKPNIFKYATKELSQDAFIYWLLDHANPEYESVNQGVKEVAYKLLKKFFELESIPFPEKINDLKLSKQHKNIDILCRINNKFTIIIEDKTGTSSHGNQLIRYKELIVNEFNEDKVLAIYFKTHDQSNYTKEEEDGFKVFTRSNLLEVFNTQNEIGSEIFNDFRQYIQEIEDEVNAFVHKEDNKWNHKNWIGFFKYLKKELNRGNWGYVPNQNGGFMGYWWAFQKNEYCWQYLQIQQETLVLKISSHKPESYTEFRKICYQHYLNKARGENLSFEKPARFGKGETMTVLTTNYLVRNDKTGLINIEETLEILKKYTKFIETYALSDKDFTK